MLLEKRLDMEVRTLCTHTDKFPHFDGVSADEMVGSSKSSKREIWKVAQKASVELSLLSEKGFPGKSSKPYWASRCETKQKLIRFKLSTRRKGRPEVTVAISRKRRERVQGNVQEDAGLCLRR